MTQASTVSDALVRAAVTGHGLVTIEHDGCSTRMSYDRLLRRALSAAAALIQAGLEPGDHVALVVPEVAGFIEAFFGILAAGLVPIPMAPPAQAGDIATFSRQSHQLLSASRAAAIVTTDD